MSVRRLSLILRFQRGLFLRRLSVRRRSSACFHSPARGVWMPVFTAGRVTRSSACFHGRASDADLAREISASTSASRGRESLRPPSCLAVGSSCRAEQSHWKPRSVLFRSSGPTFPPSWSAVPMLRRAADVSEHRRPHGCRSGASALWANLEWEVSG